MRKITCLLLLLCLLPSFALAEKTITLTFTGDITLGGEDYLRTAEDSFFAVYEREGAGYFLKNFADFFAEDDLTVVNLEGVLTNNNAPLPARQGQRRRWLLVPWAGGVRQGAFRRERGSRVIGE